MEIADWKKLFAPHILFRGEEYGYPEGREKAAELAKGWRRDFPRRSAMLDELKKVKL